MIYIMATARYLQRGLGFKSLGQHVNNFLKRTKAISRVANYMGHPKVGSVANYLGYGRRRRRRAVGSGLKLAGQGLSLSGGRRMRVSKMGRMSMPSMRPLPMMY
jgi:hypothetical protein